MRSGHVFYRIFFLSKKAASNCFRSGFSIWINVLISPVIVVVPVIAVISVIAIVPAVAVIPAVAVVAPVPVVPALVIATLPSFGLCVTFGFGQECTS